MDFAEALRLVLTLLFWSAVADHKKFCHKDGMHTVTCNYIPKDIPKGITDVRIIDFKEINKNFTIDTSYFQSSNWANVKHFELKETVSNYPWEVSFQSKCFQGLEQLNELHILSTTMLYIDAKAFIGLNALKLLNMSGCVRLDLKDLIPSLKGKEKLPALDILILSKINTYRKEILINHTFAEALKGKTITHLDFSGAKISDIDLPALVENIKKLQVLNLSRSTINNIVSYDGIDIAKKMENLTVDISHVQYLLPGKMNIYNENFKTSKFKGSYKFLLPFKILNATDFISKGVSIRIKNCTLDMNEPLHWSTKELIFRKNGIKIFDLKCMCGNYTLSSFYNMDFAQNEVEFIHPSVFSCVPNLESLDLSMNNLYKMNTVLFAQLLFPLKNLKYFFLSSNYLKFIPKTFFRENGRLEEIDLSNNQLNQVTFLDQLHSKLALLNLQKNSIKTLGEVSRNRLDSIKQENKNLKVLLKSNPISCSDCNSKPFITWLTSTDTFEPDLYCITENGERLKINHDQGINHVQRLCQRKKIILISSAASVGTALIVVVAVTVIYKWRKHAIANANRTTYLRNLINGDGRYEFVAFLSFSDKDKDFVTDYVTENLNENLQLMTGIERDLICTGDKYFRPGYPIFDETVRCMQRASLVIAIVTNSFCESVYCNIELQQAHHLQRPIIIMLKEEVDENLMAPAMNLLFRNNVRILWRRVNNTYILQTTWQNVCSAMLDIIAQN